MARLIVRFLALVIYTAALSFGTTLVLGNILFMFLMIVTLGKVVAWYWTVQSIVFYVTWFLLAAANVDFVNK